MTPALLRGARDDKGLGFWDRHDQTGRGWPGWSGVGMVFGLWARRKNLFGGRQVLARVDVEEGVGWAGEGDGAGGGAGQGVADFVGAGFCEEVGECRQEGGKPGGDQMVLAAAPDGNGRGGSQPRQKVSRNKGRVDGDGEKPPGADGLRPGQAGGHAGEWALAAVRGRIL